MKKILSLFLTVLLLSGSAVTAFCVDGCEKNFRLVAHRGVSELAPENTIPAFELAGEYGYYGVEFDLQITSDGQWIVAHEDDVGRVSNGDGLISQKTFEQVRQLRIDSGAGVGNYEEIKFPSLYETLDICKEYSLRPYIEVKAGGESELDELMNTLDLYGLTDQSVIMSTEKWRTSYLKSHYSEVTVWLVSYFSLPSDVKFAVENNLDGISFYTHFYNPALTPFLQNNDITISFWVVDNNSWKALSSLYGAKYFTTNNLKYDENGNPELLLTGVSSLKAGYDRLVSFFTQCIAIVISTINNII